MQIMEHIRQSIFAFLNNKNLKVLAITGDWGVGKTYFWKNEIFNNIPIEDKKDYYSYVSLFNIETINDLKIKLYYESKPMLKEDSNIPQLSYIDTINKSIEAIQKLQRVKIDNYLICFDDIERKSDNLDLRTFLGYVSELKELYDNKIVIIFNYNEMTDADKQILGKNKEKVFDSQIEFSPSPDYNQNIIFEDIDYINTIKNTLKPMNVKNMRILKFIDNNIKFLMKTIEKTIVNNATAKSEVISTITFNTWLHYQTEMKFKIENLENFFSYRIKLSEEDETIRRKIQEYGYRQFEEYEKEIINFLSLGYLNIGEFIKKIEILLEKINKNLNQSVLQKKLESLWGIYNHNFIGNDSDFLKSSETFIIENINHLSYRYLQEIIGYINKIDPKEDTNKYIDMYINSNISKFNKNDIKFFLSKTINDEIIKKLEFQNSQIIENNTLKSTIYKIVKSSGWNPEDEEFLDLHSEDEIYKWLKEENDSELLSIIRGALRIFQATSGNSHKESFSRKFHAALLKIWQEGDTLDKLRINEFLGIQTPTD